MMSCHGANECTLLCEMGWFGTCGWPEHTHSPPTQTSHTICDLWVLSPVDVASSEAMKAHCDSKGSSALASVYVRLININDDCKQSDLPVPRCCPYSDVNQLSSKVTKFVFKLTHSPMCNKYVENIDGANGPEPLFPSPPSELSRPQLANLSLESKMIPSNTVAHSFPHRSQHVL